jgi:HPt (histidine-containing phosphotransfer) domain-containing protein
MDQFGNNHSEEDGETPLAGLESFVPGFMRDRRKELDMYLGSGQSLDTAALAKLAHQWKGFSEPYGFKALGLMAQELEQKAKAGDQTECHRILAQIDQYLRIKEKQF